MYVLLDVRQSSNLGTSPDHSSTRPPDSNNTARPNCSTQIPTYKSTIMQTIKQLCKQSSNCARNRAIMQKKISNCANKQATVQTIKRLCKEPSNYAKKTSNTNSNNSVRGSPSFKEAATAVSLRRPLLVVPLRRSHDWWPLLVVPLRRVAALLRVTSLLRVTLRRITYSTHHNTIRNSKRFKNPKRCKAKPSNF